MLTTRKQFSFPQFRIPWVEPDRIEKMEKSRGNPFNYNTQNILISIGYPCSYSQVDHGVFGGCTVDHEVMIDDTDISKGLIFRRNIKNTVLFAKTITQPFAEPNIEYEWKLEKPIKYPDAIEQHQFITKRYTRNFGLFDVRDNAINELCEDLQYNRDQEIRSNILISFDNRDTVFRKYIVYTTGPYLDRVVMKSLTFTEKTNFTDSENSCETCELPYDIPKIDTVGEKQLISRIKSIQYFRIEGRDVFGCRTDHNYYIFEANPINSDETFKQTLEAKFPTEILSTDLSPHIRNEAVLLLREGLLYIVSRHGSTRLALPEEHCWISVVYGPHPRFVVCANEKSVYACQLKQGKLSCYERLYRVTQTRIVALSRHPTNPYIFALASLTAIYLMDVRQPFIPYFSISPDMTGPIEFLTLSHIAGTPEDLVKVLTNNRDGELRVFAFSGGMGLTPDEIPNPPSQSEMLFQSDSLGESLAFLAPELFFSCRKRFETDCAGNTLCILPSSNKDISYYIIISISGCGDLSWQQLIQTSATSKPNCVLIKPTNQDYKTLLKWMEQGKDQYFSNFKVPEIYLDFLIESMEYFHANKLLNWMFLEEEKCFTCYELKLPFNTKNFPSLNKLYFQSGWPKYSNWAKCDFGNSIPVLRYTRVSFKGRIKSKRRGKLEERNRRRFMKYLRILPDSTLAQDCSCLLSIDDFVNIDKESYELPWKPIDGLANDCSELFTNLWESWSSDTNNKLPQKSVTDDNTTLQEISEYLEPIREDIDGEIIEIIENEIATKDPNEIASQPFPEKGAKLNSQGKDSQIDPTNESSQKEIEDYSSDAEWPMEWVDFSNTYSTFPNYDNLPSFSNFSVPDDYESPLSKFPPIKTTPQKASSTAGTAKVKKTKRKIGF